MGTGCLHPGGGLFLTREKLLTAFTVHISLDPVIQTVQHRINVFLFIVEPVSLDDTFLNRWVGKAVPIAWLSRRATLLP